MTVTGTLKGDIVEEFEAMMAETGLNKSQLTVQMIYHCMNRTEELKDFYRRLALIGR